MSDRRLSTSALQGQSNHHYIEKIPNYYCWLHCDIPPGNAGSDNFSVCFVDESVSYRRCIVNQCTSPHTLMRQDRTTVMILSACKGSP